MAKNAFNIRKRADGRYEARITVNRKRYSIYGKTRKEVQEKTLQFLQEIAEKSYIRNNTITLDGYFKEWKKIKAQSVSEKTIGDYARMYRKHISPVFGKARIKDIERRQVIEFQGAIYGKYSTGTVQFIMKILRQIMKSAVIDEIISRNVCETVPNMKKKATERPARETIHRALTAEELRVFFKYAGPSRHCDIFRLLLEPGMRIGECCALAWRDIDWKEGVVHIRRTTTMNEEGHFKIGHTTKTKSSARDIPINEAIAAILKRQRDLYHDLHGGAIYDINAPVFQSERGGALYPNAVRSAFSHVLEKAAKNGEAIRPFSIHAFRDTFASMAAARGVDMNVLKELLGHASLAMTSDLYCQVFKKQKAEAMKTLHIVNG